jgi:hypothetical protein
MCQVAEQWSENSATLFAEKAHKREIEFATETLARIIAPSMPVPHFPTTRDVKGGS